MIRYFRTFSLYTFVGFLNAGIGFLLLPILTAYLTPADYGIISLVNVYVMLLMPIVGLSSSGYITVEYHNPTVSRGEFKRVFSSVRSIPLVGILILSLIFLLCQSFLPGIMELPHLAYWMVLPLTLFSLYTNNFSAFLATSKRANAFAATTVFKLVLEISLTLLLVVYIGLNWEGRIHSALATVFIFTIISIFLFRKWDLLSFHVNKDYIRKAILFGTPLIFHQIGKFVINQSDRIFLAKMISVEEMGIYSVGYQIGNVILIIVLAFSNFFSPFLYERLAKNTEQGKREVVKVSYAFIGGTLLAVILLSLVTPLIFGWMIDSRYASGASYVIWVGLGYFFWGIYTIFSGYIFYSKKTKVLGWLAFANVVINLLLNFLLISWIGALGAAIATCISYFLVAVFMLLYVVRRYPMPWKDVLSSVRKS